MLDEEEEAFLRLMENAEEAPEFQKYGKAAVLIGVKWDEQTPLNLIFDGLNKILKTNWTLEKVHIINFNGETKLYIQEAAGDIEKFRGIKNANFAFKYITGETTYKVAWAFHRRDGEKLSATDGEDSLKSVKTRHPDIAEFLVVYEGWSDRYISITLAHKDLNVVCDLMEKYRYMDRNGTGKIISHHLEGHLYPHTFFTADKKWKKWVVSKVGTETEFRQKHEDGIYKSLDRSKMAVYAAKVSFIQRLPTLNYFVWCTEAGYKLFARMENAKKHFYTDQKGKHPFTIRPFEKKAYERKDEFTDDRSAFQKAHRYGESQRD